MSSVKIKINAEIKNIVENAAWLFADKIFRMVVGLFVGLWMARYLGPEKFGIINFAYAYIGIFGPLVTLGLQNIVIKNIVDKPEEKFEIIGSASLLIFVSGIVFYTILVNAILYIRPNETIVQGIVSIMAIILLCKFSDVAIYWFEANTKSKIIVLVQVCGFIVFSLVKVYLILTDKAIYYFAYSIAMEFVFNGTLIVIYLNNDGLELRKIKISIKKIKELLTSSYPLIFSATAVIMHMQIDQLMLGKIIGDKAVGIYAAAVRISEVWYFAITIIMGSVFPHLTRLNNSNNDNIIKMRWEQIYSIMLWMSLSVAIFLTIFSNLIINALYGEKYSEAAAILAVHVWSGISVAVGVVWSRWLILENKSIIGIYSNLCGLILNIVLNLALIPSGGPLGAAIATLVSYTVGALLGFLLYKPEVSFKYIIKSLNIVNNFKYIFIKISTKQNKG